MPCTMKQESLYNTRILHTDMELLDQIVMKVLMREFANNEYKSSVFGPTKYKYIS